MSKSTNYIKLDKDKKGSSSFTSLSLENSTIIGHVN